ncbi:PREDICTED: uncharacterized protein LOC106321419, partial [Brassica oleracea var. oleracea]|uniref:uncharacterized protein LOC106321419 n=1 Tax=Brassica oleracea var. oleracea TaxID=109376 RepID=UPI0006A6D621
MIEKKLAATTIVFGDLLPSEVKGMHVSAQQEFHYETNWRMLPTLSWIQQTRQRNWAGRLQIYLWKPGAYDSILIILGECSARARTSLGNKDLEADQNVLLLDHVKVCKPLDLQKLQYHFRDCQSKSGDGDFIRVNGEVISGVGGELMFSSQIKEKPPDGLSLHQSPNKPTRGYSNDQSIKNGSLAKLEMQQSNLGSCLAASFDIGAVRGSYLNNQKELSNKLDCNRNLTHLGLTSNWNHVQSFSGEIVMSFRSRVILCLRTSQFYLWRPDMMHLFLSKEPCADFKRAWKHIRRNYKNEEDKRFKPPDLDQDNHQDVPGFIIIKEAPPDAAYNPKPSRNKFGIRLLLYDNFA